MHKIEKQYEALGDEQLMSFVAGGDEKAFNALYLRYATPLYRYFYRMLYQDKALADDSLQELFLKVVEKAEQFDSKYSFPNWLYGIAANLCKNEYRRRARYQERISKLNTAEAQSQNLEEQMDRAFWSQAVQQAIEQLEEPHRQCFVLRFQEERSVKDIAAILNCPEGTVKSRLFYSIKKLSGQLQKLSAKSK